MDRISIGEHNVLCYVCDKRDNLTRILFTDSYWDCLDISWKFRGDIPTSPDSSRILDESDSSRISNNVIRVEFLWDNLVLFGPV
jgi:hypothetical protein